MADDKKQRNKFMATLATGAAIGAAVALLLSPRRGRELRAQLREGGTSVVEFVRQRTGKVEKPPAVVEESKPTPAVKASRSDYDVIVVGGGHNGLVTAVYLAKIGRKVLLLEKREMVGGTAVTQQLFPNTKISTLADEVGYLSPTVIADLNLEQHGLQILPTDPLIFSPQPDGRSLTFWHDTNRTAQEIAKFSQADAEAYPQFIAQMSKFSQVVAGLKNMTPPDMPDMGMGDMRELLNLANPVRGLGRKNIAQVIRVMPMSVSDLLDEWFESDVVKGAVAASAVKDISWGPQEAGTAYLLLYNWSGSNNGLFRSSGQVKGGMGALSQAMANAARSFGAEILTGTDVTKIIMQDGQATAVQLSNGDEISAAVVVSAADMRTTFLKLVDPYYLDRTFVRHVQNIKYRGTAARVHFVLDRLPTFTAVAESDAHTLLSGRIQIAPTMTYLQQAYDPVKYGACSQRPYLDIHIPTLTDSSLAPEGKHIMSVTIKYTPYHLRQGDWNEKRESISQLTINTIAQYAPNFAQSVERCQVITPLDMETDYGLPEGNINHGEMTLDQFLWMRPIPGYAQYRAPIGDLYLCGAATHPGGGVTGINGKNAAREILKAWK
ncbi:MAG: FAD-dependent oxidoreductase [Anaerolineae bacterium]